MHQTQIPPELDYDVTPQEMKAVADAMKKKEFRDLLGEYMDEISDPKNVKVFQN